jgi:hypothetical protein
MDISRSGFAEAAAKFADIERRGGIWEVWAKYDIRPRKGGRSYVVGVEPDLPPAPNLKRDIERALEKSGGRVEPGSTADALIRQAAERRDARKEEGDYSNDRVYLPLVEYPDLFLRFARLADEGKLDDATTKEELDTDKNAEAAKDWAETYGTLGLTRVEPDEFGFRGAYTLGGEADTVAAFAHEAWVANGCLRLYEAATAEELDAELIASYMTPRGKALHMSTPAQAQEFALGVVATQTQGRVAGNAYPVLYGEVGRFVQGWSFTNLLGAMWLQMFWLLTASEAPRRCRECGEIIPPEPPNLPPGTKKRGRKKEKFCDKTCDNRYRYRTDIKPRRQAAKARRSG